MVHLAHTSLPTSPWLEGRGARAVGRDVVGGAPGCEATKRTCRSEMPRTLPVRPLAIARLSGNGFPQNDLDPEVTTA